MTNNPNGKKGSKKHQDVQNAEFEKAKDEFDGKDVKVETEVPVSTLNGKKKLRIADVAAYSSDEDNNIDYLKIVQVGKTDKSGKPVKREQEAIEDLEKHTHIKVNFVDYDNYLLENNG